MGFVCLFVLFVTCLLLSLRLSYCLSFVLFYHVLFLMCSVCAKVKPSRQRNDLIRSRVSVASSIFRYNLISAVNPVVIVSLPDFSRQ